MLNSGEIANLAEKLAMKDTRLIGMAVIRSVRGLLQFVLGCLPNPVALWSSRSRRRVSSPLLIYTSRFRVCGRTCFQI